MSTIGQPERDTQNRVIALFRDELEYRYLDDWTDRPSNSNIEEDLLTACLTKAATRRRRSPSASTSCAPRRTIPTAASTTTTRRFTACFATACR